MQVKKDNKSFYETPLSIVIFMLIIYFISKNDLFIKIAVVVGVAALLSDAFSKYLSIGWGKLLALFGYINTHILLTLIFALVLLPISFLYRLFKKDSLNMKSGKSSYFETRDLKYEAKDLKNPW